MSHSDDFFAKLPLRGQVFIFKLYAIRPLDLIILFKASR